MQILLYTNSMVYKFYVCTLIRSSFFLHMSFSLLSLVNSWLFFISFLIVSSLCFLFLTELSSVYFCFLCIHSCDFLKDSYILFNTQHQFILLFYRQYSIKFKVFFVLLMYKFSLYSFVVWIWASYLISEYSSAKWEHGSIYIKVLV